MATVTKRARFCHAGVIKTVTVLTSIVYRTFAAAPIKSFDNRAVWRKYLEANGSTHWNCAAQRI